MASLKRCGVLAMFFFVCQTLLLIQTLPLQAEELSKEVEKGHGGQEAVSARGVAGMEGLATYYAKRYKGKKTKSGERYRPEKLTAAHPSLPLGTKVKVVNLDNKNEVVVKINDRCRKREVHNIDLSMAAAKKLGFLGKGMARVLIAPLNEESS